MARAIYKTLTGGVKPWWPSGSRIRTSKHPRCAKLKSIGWTEHECRHGLYYVPPGIAPLVAQIDNGIHGVDIAIANGLPWATVVLVEDEEFSLLSSGT